MSIIRTAILGASGYTGAELVRLLHQHPHMQLTALAAHSKAGHSYADIYPQLRHLPLPPLVEASEIDWSRIELVFCALPHGTSQAAIAALPPSIRIVDLSADFRLRNLETYAQWYGQAHQAPALQPAAVYGLTEHNRDAIAGARLVANPGCYPTSILLPLLPLLKQQLIQPHSIIADSKSGVTGAGRSAKEANLFCELNESFSAYAIGNHRHLPEIEQELSSAAQTSVQIRFTPHLLPINRGIFSTLYVDLAPNVTPTDLRQALTQQYLHDAFVHILPEAEWPKTRDVRGSNFCHIAVGEDRIQGKAILVSVIDNLVKGAAGQAIQNANLMFHLPETTALLQAPLFP